MIKVSKGKIVTIMVTCALAVSILLCMGVIVQVLSKGYAGIGGFSLFRVVTGSMEPEIPVGALLITRETEIEEIEVGDIVTFRSQEQGMLGVLITHRVKAIYTAPDGTVLLETKGDANQYADGYFVEADNLIGRAVYYTKNPNPLAGIFNLLTNKVGFMACIVLPCLLFGLIAMRDCIGDLKREIELVTNQLDADAASEDSPKDSLEAQMSEAEYRELCERLKQELLEELKQSVGEDQVHKTE